jgi:hypothetical protein
MWRRAGQVDVGIVKFTALQRLFRLAFAGELGNRFPWSDIVLLAMNLAPPGIVAA